MNSDDLLRNLFIMALADGEISAEELSLLAERRDRWGLTKAHFEATLKEVEASSAPLQLPIEQDERRQLLSEMAALIAADGKFHDMEINMFALAAARLDVGEDELNEILQQLTNTDDVGVAAPDDLPADSKDSDSKDSELDGELEDDDFDDDFDDKDFDDDALDDDDELDDGLDDDDDLDEDDDLEDLDDDDLVIDEATP
jgi:uncharacterized tellurite resistance protein B-like protein